MQFEGRSNWLTLRQKQCLKLVREGMTSKEIARSLHIAPSTVDNHIKTALARLNCVNRHQAAALLFGETPTTLAQGMHGRGAGAKPDYPFRPGLRPNWLYGAR